MKGTTEKYLKRFFRIRSSFYRLKISLRESKQPNFTSLVTMSTVIRTQNV